jgi:TonB-dependent starch-binding outer membrane protein SusC
LSLAYNLPSAMLSKLKISRAKVWVSAFNLFTITKWDGWDPEANQGLTYNLNPNDATPNDKYPTMKRYTIGVNFAF